MESTVSSLLKLFSALIDQVKNFLAKRKKGKEGTPHVEEINATLQRIAEHTKGMISEVHINEITVNYLGLEHKIKCQYDAFIIMNNLIMKDQDNAECYKSYFMELYMKLKGDLNIDELYNSIMGDPGVFGRSMLKDYQEHYKQNPKELKDRCDHLLNLMKIGITAKLVYWLVMSEKISDADAAENQVMKDINEWVPRLEKIQTKMIEILNEK